MTRTGCGSRQPTAVCHVRGGHSRAQVHVPQVTPPLGPWKLAPSLTQDALPRRPLFLARAAGAGPKGLEARSQTAQSSEPGADVDLRDRRRRSARPHTRPGNEVAAVNAGEGEVTLGCEPRARWPRPPPSEAVGAPSADLGAGAWARFCSGLRSGHARRKRPRG